MRAEDELRQRVSSVFVVAMDTKHAYLQTAANIF